MNLRRFSPVKSIVGLDKTLLQERGTSALDSLMFLNI